jgi:peptide/nickel transport system permease protein
MPVIVSRLLGSAIAIFGASILAFILLRAIPGDPARLIVGPFATEEAVAAQRAAMGLDEPYYEQYWLYISGFFTGDWGFSYTIGDSVRSQIGNRLPASIELGLAAFFLAFVSAVALALFITYRRRRVTGGVVRGVALVGLGTPPFWIGLLLLLVFFEYLGVLPGPEGQLSSASTPPPERTHFVTLDALLAGQWGTFGDALKHLVLPAIALGLAVFAILIRILRANLLEVSREPFISVARSKGLRRWTAFRRHALPNAFLPTLTVAGLLFAQILAGSILVEAVFEWPGLGALVIDSVLRKDFAIVQTVILLSAFLYVTVNLAVDVLYGVIDPRVHVLAKES